MKKELSTPDQSIRILKIDTCPTLSGRSELTYQVGCNEKQEVCFRVVQNSGNGQFNVDWVSLSIIKNLLAEHPAGKPMNSFALRSVFRGKSSNSPAFLFAVLKAEGLVLPGHEKDSGYLLSDIEVFKAAISALIGTDINLAEPKETLPKPTKKKRPTKEPA